MDTVKPQHGHSMEYRHTVPYGTSTLRYDKRQKNATTLSAKTQYFPKIEGAYKHRERDNPAMEVLDTTQDRAKRSAAYA